MSAKSSSNQSTHQTGSSHSHNMDKKLGLAKKVSRRYEGPDLDKRLDDTVESIGTYASVDDALDKIREYLTERGYNVVEWWNYRGCVRPSYSKDRKCATICKNSKTREKNDERLKNFILSIYSVPNLGKYASYMNHVTIGIGTSATMPSPDEPVPPFFWSGAGLERDIEGFSNFFEREGEVPLSPYIIRKLVDFVEERYNNRNKPIVANESSLGVAKKIQKTYQVKDPLSNLSMKQILIDSLEDIFKIDEDDENPWNVWGFWCTYNEGDSIDLGGDLLPGCSGGSMLLKSPLVNVRPTILARPLTGEVAAIILDWESIESLDKGREVIKRDEIPEEVREFIDSKIEVEEL